MVSGNASAASLLQGLAAAGEHRWRPTLAGSDFGSQIGNLLSGLSSSTLTGPSFLQSAWRGAPPRRRQCWVGQRGAGQEIASFLNQTATSVFARTRSAQRSDPFCSRPRVATCPLRACCRVPCRCLSRRSPPTSPNVLRHAGRRLLQQAAAGTLSGASFLQSAGALLQAAATNLGSTLDLRMSVPCSEQAETTAFGNTTLGAQVGAFLNQAVAAGSSAAGFAGGAVPLDGMVSAGLPNPTFAQGAVGAINRR